MEMRQEQEAMYAASDARTTLPPPHHGTMPPAMAPAAIAAFDFDTPGALGGFLDEAGQP
jgi:hypothetical protein